MNFMDGKLKEGRKGLVWSIIVCKCFQIPVPNKEHREPIPEGSSRYWELGNPSDSCVCVGGMGPIYFEDGIKVSDLIDFQNEVSPNPFF